MHAAPVVSLEERKKKVQDLLVEFKASSTDLHSKIPAIENEIKSILALLVWDGKIKDVCQIHVLLEKLFVEGIIQSYQGRRYSQAEDLFSLRSRVVQAYQKALKWDPDYNNVIYGLQGSCKLGYWLTSLLQSKGVNIDPIIKHLNNTLWEMKGPNPEDVECRRGDFAYS
jgi:hypothetical protein